MHVPASAVAELPLERRLTLLDAENDLLAADDVVDAAQEKVDAQPALRREAEAKLRAAKDQKSSDAVSDAAIAEGEAGVAWNERQGELRRAELNVAEMAMLVAQARFEEARASEVETAGLSGAHGIHKEEFHEQVMRLSAAQAKAEAKKAEVQAKADDAEKKWKDARAELTRLTGGAQGSVWVQ